MDSDEDWLFEEQTESHIGGADGNQADVEKATAFPCKSWKLPGPSSYEPKAPKPIPSPLKGLREPGSSSYDASGRRNVG